MELTRRAFTDLHDILGRMERLVGDHTGIIREVFPVERTTPFDVLHYYNATLANTHSLAEWSLPPAYGGSAWTREASLAAAMGEAVERYACGVYCDESWIWAAYRDVASEAIPLEYLTLFTPEQYARLGVASPSPDTRLRWVEGYSLTRQRQVLAPAALVFMPYKFGADEDRIIWESTTSGAACGGSLEEAILSGIYEVVERDAMMITWLNQLPAPRVCLEQVTHPHVAYALERIANTSYQLVVNDITTDLPLPVFLAVLLNENGTPPCSVVAAACGLDKRRAVFKSIVEVLQGVQATQKLLELNPGFGTDQPVRTMEEHTLLYARFDLRARLDFLTACPTVRPWAAIPSQASGQAAPDVETCVRLLGKYGYEVIVVDITPPEAAECGLSVVRVIVPGLTPLHGLSTHRPLGVKRVGQAPLALGYGPRELNPYPHPFP
jgi:ribosomal protein S12 methylthiotransferase accessory factor